MTIAYGGQYRVIEEAIAALNEAHSPSTRTHIQKLLYFATAWNVIDEHHYKFVLHHHGPYSFELDRDILKLEAFGSVSAMRDPQGFGAKYEVQDVTANPTLGRLALWLGSKPGRALEALATSEYFALMGEPDPVRAVRTIKPHLTEAEVKAALLEAAVQKAELAGT